MKTYHKIENVWSRSPDSNLLIPESWRTEAFSYLCDLDWEATEKVDGTNVRICYHDKGLDAHYSGDACAEQCWWTGKTDRAQLPGRLRLALEALFPEQTKHEQFRSAFYRSDPANAGDPLEVCLYGEGYGPGIQKAGTLYGPEVRVVIFDVWVNGIWLQRADAVDVCNRLGLAYVPIIALAPLPELIDIVREGFDSFFSNCLKAEGVVARPLIELKDRRGNRIITKIKTRDFSC